MIHPILLAGRRVRWTALFGLRTRHLRLVNTRRDTVGR